MAVGVARERVRRRARSCRPRRRCRARDLEHGGLHGLVLVRGHPVHDGIVERLGVAGTDAVGDFGEGPGAGDGDGRAGDEDAGRGVGVADVLPNEAEDAENEIPEEVETYSGVVCRPVSAFAAWGFDVCILYKTRAGEQVVLRKSLWVNSLNDLRCGSQW